MDYKSLIEKRQSVREFRDRKVSASDLNEVHAFYESVEKLIPDIQTELRIYDTPDIKNRLEGVAGYKGFAFGAPAYLVLLSGQKDGYMINAGFIGEALCLKLTDMDLDGCWLTVNDSEAAKRALILETDKEVAVILAVGYGKEKKTQKRLDIINPANVKYNEREDHAAPKIAQDEMVYSEKWGQKMDWGEHAIDPLVDEAFYAASLAPSFLNRQPYRYILQGSRVLLAAKPEEIASEDDTLLDIGATMFNFHIMYSDRHSGPAAWKLGVPDDAGDIGLPQEYQIVAYYELG